MRLIDDAELVPITETVVACRNASGPPAVSGGGRD